MRNSVPVLARCLDFPHKRVAADMAIEASSSRSKKPTPVGAKLTLIDFHSEAESDILLHQRELCGWNQDKIPTWRGMQDEGEKRMFWITLPPSTPEIVALAPSRATRLIQRDGSDLVPVGHVSLDRIDDRTDLNDLSLANPDGSVLTIATLFVIPDLSGLGLANFAMSTLEEWAGVPPYGFPNCTGVTIHTLAGKYVDVEGPDCRGMWARCGLPAPEKGRSNESWYARRGYVKYKEEPRITMATLDGVKVYWDCAFMRKEVRAPSTADKTAALQSDLVPPERLASVQS